MNEVDDTLVDIEVAELIEEADPAALAAVEGAGAAEEAYFAAVTASGLFQPQRSVQSASEVS